VEKSTRALQAAEFVEPKSEENALRPSTPALTQTSIFDPPPPAQGPAAGRAFTIDSTPKNR
jgi:hypothetical protein